MAALDLRRRRKPQRVLVELRSEGRCTALRREPRCLVERACDARVWEVPGQGKVPCTRERVVDDLCEPRVDARVVDGRGQQWVSEANRAVLAHDHPRSNRRFEHLRRHAGTPEQGLRSCPDRGDERERRARLRRQPGHPSVHELVQRVGHGQRLGQIDLRTERAGDFERVERIPARLLVNAQQRLAREDAPRAIMQERVERADTERSQPQTLEVRLRERPLDFR